MALCLLIANSVYYAKLIKYWNWCNFKNFSS